VWLDVVVGTWEEPELPGHATFSCRIGIDGAGLVDACCGVEGRAPYFGNKLSREMLSPTHDFPRSGTFWISS
jgi:hypothetical protein